MITKQHAEGAVEQVAECLMKMSYVELVELGNDIARHSEHDRTVVSVDGRDAIVTMTISTTGVLQKRVCVELDCFSDSMNPEHPLASRYFEKFGSGRIYVAQYSTLALYAICFLALLGCLSMIMIVVYLSKRAFSM